MQNFVALFGLIMFWLSLCWLPLVILRVIKNRGGAQTWSIAALCTFGMAFMGFTRAMIIGTPMEAFAWSVTWAMPFGLAVFARSAPDAVYRNYDKWVGAGAALLFIVVLPFLPSFLRTVAAALW